MINPSQIPNDRTNIPNKTFQKDLRQRQAEHKQEYFEKYCELKYTLVYFACTYGLGFAVFFWLLAICFAWVEIKKACEYYLTTLATLYVGSLLSKEFN